MFNSQVFVVDGLRSPFLKANAKVGPGPFSASELAVQAGKTLLLRQTFEPSEIDEIILGCTTPSVSEMNIARVVSLRLNCSVQAPAWPVHRNCASGLQSIDSAAQSICSGRSDLVLCGGTDSLSNAPLIFSKSASRWFSQFSTAKGLRDKLVKVKDFKPSFLLPVISILKGLTDPVVGESMGQTAENLAKKFNLTRRELDEYSVRSHKQALSSMEDVLKPQTQQIYDAKGNFYEHDNGIRPDIKIEKLATLRAVFDKPDGKITAGNSSQITDGSALLLLASEKAVKKFALKPLAIVKDINWSGLNPTEMGLGPIHALIPILKRQKLERKDIDLWEINEAFAAQVLACQAALDSFKYCSKVLKYRKTFGAIEPNKLNIAGGAIAIGHPVGASGARIILNLIHLLKKNSLKRGLASICIGGGQGGASLIELC